jgi:hypothetical protein
LNLEHVPTSVATISMTSSGQWSEEYGLINADLADGDEVVAKAFRSLIETVTILPTSVGTPPGILVKGGLGPLLEAVSAQSGVAATGGRAVPGERIELPTNGLQNRCSTAELTRQIEG